MIPGAAALKHDLAVKAAYGELANQYQALGLQAPSLHEIKEEAQTGWRSTLDVIKRHREILRVTLWRLAQSGQPVAKPAEPTAG